MLVALARIQETFLARADVRGAFDELLGELLELTASEYGFIGEVHLDPSGSPYLKTQAITNIAWDEATRAFYEANVPGGLEFRNLDTLFGHCLETRELVISNDPAGDPHSGGVPVGHPALLAFAGIPFLHGGRLVGMAGLANRPGGYDLALIERFQPVFDSVRTLLIAHRAERDRAHAEAELRRSEIENQAKLRLSEAKFAAAFHGSADAVLISRVADGIFFEANDAAVALSGRPREELLGKDALALAAWEDIHRRDELWRLLARDGRVADFEARLRTGAGEVRDTLLHATIIDIAGERCQLTVIKDVTENRRADRAMRDSEQRLRAIFESAVDAIVVIDERGVIEAINPMCERVFGYRLAELVGENVSRLMPEGQRGAHDEHLARQRRGAANRVIGVERELMAQRKDGTSFPVEIALSEFQDSRGRRFSGTIRDISRRKEAETAATRLNRELTDSVAALERMNRENAIMSELRDLFQTCQTVEEVVRIAMQFTRRLLGGTSGALYLLDATRGLLEEAARWGDTVVSEPIFSKDDCWALRRGRIFEAVPGDQGVCCEHMPRRFGACSICVPLSAQGDTLGILHVEDGLGQGPSALDSRVPSALSEYISLAIVNVRMRETLRRQATRDPLTLLFNRRHLDEVFERELRRAERHGRHLTIILLDIDHFKRINDSRGHDVGDHVLKEVAQALSSSIRAEDYAFRYGGEEFLLLLPDGGDASSLLPRADALVRRVRELPLTWHGQPLGAVTISAGIASFPAHGRTTSELVRAADEALLLAKADGRDRAMVASGSLDLAHSPCGAGNA